MPFRIRPTYIVKNVQDINVQDLKDEGIKALIFDLDNTLMTPYSGEFSDEIVSWIEDIEKSFKIAILSNNLSAEYIQKIESNVAFPIYGNAQKPAKTAALRLIKELDVLPSQCAIIGDSPLTDILLGMRLGLVSILVDPLFKHKEPKYIQFLQKIGRLLVHPPKKEFNYKNEDKKD